MLPVHRLAKPLSATLAAAAVLALAWSAPRPGHGQAPAPGAPNESDLLKSPPFDRITLIDNTPISVEPVSPRPLPPLVPVKEKRPRSEDANRIGPPAEGNVGVAEKAKKKGDEPILELTIHRIDGEPGDFRVKRSSIKRIDYFEDLLLAEVDRLLIARNFPKAFEHLLLVKERNPSWKGLEEKFQKYLYEEGTYLLLLENDVVGGQRLLRELHVRNPKYPGLANQLAVAYGGRIEKTFEKGSYREGRRVLHDLEGFAPDHPVVKEWRERFIARAKSLAERATKAEGGDRLDSAAEVVRVWPSLEGAGELFQEAFRKLPTLDVGVIDVPRQLGPWVRCPADERATRLVYLPILAADTEDAARGRLPDQLAAELQSTDLGRRLELTLRKGATWSDGSRPVSSIDVVRALSDRVQPSSLGYNARWADLLERIEAVDESQVIVRLTRPPLKPESWMLGPIGPAHAGRDGQAPTSEGARRAVGDGPFRPDTSKDGSFVLVAAWPEGQPGSPKVRRLRETRLPSAKAAIGALLRGEISLLEHVPADLVAELSKEQDVRVGRLERASMHRIALDGRNPALRNRTLRRALSYAIDRRTILEETVLRRNVDEQDGPADGVFPRDSYANAPDVRPLEYDPLLARMLVGAARKEMGGDPIKLTYEYPTTPEAVAAAPRIVEALRLVGLEIDPVARPESELELALRSGRKFDLAYRSSRPLEPVSDVGALVCPGYDAPPEADGLGAIASPRILQLLLELEHAPEWPTARGLVVQLDREVRDELPVIPLWQLRDHYAWRTRLKGPAETADSLYGGIERWEIEPWFAKDPW